MSNSKVKLNQVIAIEKNVKSRVMGRLSEVYKVVQKPTLFEGLNRTYEPIAEDDERLPPQNQKVQVVAQPLLKEIGQQLTELFDVTAAKDYANCAAVADVKVDGETLITGAPATFLLFLEKQLTDIHTFVSKLPTLDPSEDWKLDVNSELFKSEPTKTIRTKKIQKPLVLYPATPEHPAQAQVITEDVTAGTWQQVKLSGAVPEPRKKELLERIEKLQKAVKFAREEANMAAAPQQEVGAKVFSWLLR